MFFLINLTSENGILIVNQQWKKEAYRCVNQNPCEFLSLHVYIFLRECHIISSDIKTVAICNKGRTLRPLQEFRLAYAIGEAAH